MSLLKIIKAQLGISSTPANNFTLDASAQDGTMKLSRGNAGATTQDVMVVAGDGKVTFPAGSQMLGVGQTLQDVKASRAIGTTYTNTTGKPIVVSVSFQSTAGINSGILFVNTQVFGQSSGGFVGAIFNICVIIPPGGTYRATTSSADVIYWAELR